MSSTKTFNINVKPRDVLVELKGVKPGPANAYIRFWMLHALHGEPLPPREEKIDRDEWDEWFRDKLDFKNVRSWIGARDELLRLAKIRQADDGRLYIGRTMRAVEEKRGGDPSKWGGDSDQGRLCLEGVHAAQRRGVAQPPEDKVVDKPVESAGEDRQSVDVCPNIGRSSAEVRPIRLLKPLIFNGSRGRSSLQVPSLFMSVVAAVPFGAPRARGDPAACA